METRKVQQVGGGTYTVSIPISWAEEHGIKAGETAYLYTHRDGSLVVRWGEREENALGAVAVDLAEFGADGSRGSTGSAATVATRTLDAAYAAGFDRITLHTEDDAQREAITDRARTLVGVGVAEQTDAHVSVKWLLEAGSLSIEQSVRQLRFVAASMFDAAMATFTGATAEAGYITDRAEETDRLGRLIERRFTRALMLFEELDRLDATRPQLFAGYRTARELERVATEAAAIARAVERLEPAASTALADEIRTAGEATREAVETATDAVTDGGSPATAQRASERATAATEHARALQRTVAEEQPTDAVLLTRVLDSVRRTARGAETLGGIALQRSVRQ
jgi:phosphate uptake regulator